MSSVAVPPQALKVLILSQWYPPEPQSVVSDLAESLAAQGHAVQVLTGFPNWPSGRLYPGYRLRLFRREIWNGVAVTRVPLFPYHGRSPLGRVANLASFCLSALIAGPFLMRRPDIVHAIQPPTTCFPAWALSCIWRVPFTYEVQDLWPDTLQATGMVGGRGALSLVARYCRWAYRKARRIRVISQGFRRHLIERGVPASKIEVIPNWVDTVRYRPTGERTPTEPGTFRIMYAGNLGLAQGLDNVLDAAALLPAESGVRFVLVGDGVEADTLRARCASMRLTNVEFTGRKAPEEMKGILAEADAVLLHLKPDALFSVTIPSKLLTYFAVGKPILSCAAGEPTDLVTHAAAGIGCAPGDPRALTDAAQKMAGLSAEERRQMGHAGRLFALAHFERGSVVSDIGKMLRRATAEA